MAYTLPSKSTAVETSTHKQPFTLHNICGILGYPGKRNPFLANIAFTKVYLIIV